MSAGFLPRSTYLRARNLPRSTYRSGRIGSTRPETASTRGIWNECNPLNDGNLRRFLPRSTYPRAGFARQGRFGPLRGRQKAHKSATCGDSCPEARITWPVVSTPVAANLLRADKGALPNGLPTMLDDEELVALSQLTKRRSNFTSASRGGWHPLPSYARDALEGASQDSVVDGVIH
jgi:hypothetical protein